MSDEVAIVTNILMVVITFAYVVATIFICEYNKKSADAAKAQTEELKRQFDEQNRPYITVHLDMNTYGLLCLVIENDGNKPAHNVNININDAFIKNIKNENIKEYLQEFKKANIYLTSKQKVNVFLGATDDFKNMAQVPLDISISYDEYTDRTILDLKQYEALMIPLSPLKDIANILGDISAKLPSIDNVKSQ